MWVVTEGGRFYAAVEDWNNPALIRVRTRTRGDMQVTGFRFTHTPENDYSYLATVPRDRWTAFLTDAADHIAYDSLKATVRDAKRHDIMVAVWAALLALSPPGWGRYNLHLHAPYGSPDERELRRSRLRVGRDSHTGETNSCTLGADDRKACRLLGRSSCIAVTRSTPIPLGRPRRRSSVMGPMVWAGSTEIPGPPTR